jgi:RNA polymerase sigma-70 factor, ECF subfamily
MGDTSAKDSVEPPNIERLVALHHAELYRYAYRLAGSPVDAEDLTQQTFLAAHANLEQLRNAEAGRGWLFSILRNCFLKTQRKRTPLPAASLDLDVNCLPDFRAAEPSIDREQLQSAIDELPDEFKLVVLMFYFEGRSYREIAAALDLPVGTVMSRLSRGKGHLRRRLVEDESRASSERKTSQLKAGWLIPAAARLG